MRMAEVSVLVILLLCICLLQAAIRFLRKVWWTPVRLQAKLRSQRIKGPPYRFPHGNAKEIYYMRRQSLEKPTDICHDIYPRIQPHVYAWTKAYGKSFVNWHGSQCQLLVTEPELIKEILMNKEGAFPKMDMEGYVKKMLGESMVTNEGEKWAKIRKLANHTFHAESLKSMLPEMVSSVTMMLERWKSYQGNEIDVFKEFKLLTTEVISRTAFGSSYSEGKHIFEMTSKLREIAVRNVYSVRFPGISMFVKSNDEIESEKLAQKIKSSILGMVKKREKLRNDGEIEDFGSDYLGQLVKISREKKITAEQINDEIKAMYGAGHITMTILLSWCILLLATNIEWQEKAREEVNTVFDGNAPDSDSISRLKIMNMIINESLRLYPPAHTVARKVAKEAKIGHICLPPKINIYIPILALHHDPQVWGNDVHLFKPERFAEGVTKATNNNTVAFIPFGSGPRTCVGSNFTLNETKITLSMILKKYKFTISPNYVHCPADVFVLVPKNGIQVILNEI